MKMPPRWAAVLFVLMKLYSKDVAIEHMNCSTLSPTFLSAEAKSMQLASEVFACPECAGRLLPQTDRIVCSACDWQTHKHAGVVDILPRARESKWNHVDVSECERALIANLGLPGGGDDLLAIRAALEPVSPIGNPFFDAEENLFLDRFNISNFYPKVTLGPLYLPDAAGLGEFFHGAIRIINNGEFPVDSNGENAVVVSYHWRRNGEMEIFEGNRTSIPVAIKPHQSVTVPFAITAPQNEGRYTLDVTVLQEHKRWHDERTISSEMLVSRKAGPVYPDMSRGHQFSEAFDGKLAAQFVDQNLELDRNGTALEIAGGIRPSFRESETGRYWPGTFINSDVSIRLLRIADLLARRCGHPETIQARFDANRMPINAGSVDVVFVSRAIHHFEDLHAIFSEITRVLKPAGQLFILCEPVGVAYDEFTKNLISSGVNEQVFPHGIYERSAKAAGLRLKEVQCDWGFSFKGMFRKERP
ncbi:class I SAM-dependent methyltransferase [Burkholderia sp. BKH01]|uniref:class I SAM-dependent methyltransferase n=1 Tax=Burkholderia sp. BKH01 TaxID=2769262 RepID=UPI0021E0D085|nr:class I SAM-dependent methyltransferase [Burkholderia sp. BKH01]MCU9956462.1 class I SAM-dependent methyltransferase [Burkholderia sp. BKH01]